MNLILKQNHQDEVMIMGLPGVFSYETSVVVCFVFLCADPFIDNCLADLQYILYSVLYGYFWCNPLCHITYLKLKGVI